MGKVKRGGGFGKFVFGWFMGFITTIVLLGGLGFWAYKSATIKTVEKVMKSEITDNETIESKTIEDWAELVEDIIEDKDTYSIADLEKDFDVKLVDDSMYGISLTKIKNSPLKDIKKAFEKTLNSATFNNILSLVNTNNQLGLLNTMLDKNVTYYINDNTLYTSSTFVDANKVNFEYEINDGVVEFGQNSATIVTDGDVEKVDIMFRHIPINTALSIMSDVTKDLKVCEVLGYYQNDGKYYKTFDGENYANEVTGIMKVIADTNINDLGSAIDRLTASDIFDENSSIIKLLGEDANTTTINQIPDVLPSKINDTTIEDLIELNMINTDGIKPETINSIKGFTIKGFIEAYEDLLELAGS